VSDPTGEFGAALRAQRKRLGLTLEQVAERLDVTFPAVSRIERGQRSPSLRTAARYAAAYETTIVELLGGGAESTKIPELTPERRHGHSEGPGIGSGTLSGPGIGDGGLA